MKRNGCLLLLSKFLSDDMCTGFAGYVTLYKHPHKHHRKKNRPDDQMSIIFEQQNLGDISNQPKRDMCNPTQSGWEINICKVLALLKFNITPDKLAFIKRKGSSSNHHFSGAMSVSSRVISVDGRNLANQLRLVVYLIIYKFHSSQVVQEFLHQQYIAWYKVGSVTSN